MDKRHWNPGAGGAATDLYWETVSYPAMTSVPRPCDEEGKPELLAALESFIETAHFIKINSIYARLHWLVGEQPDKTRWSQPCLASVLPGSPVRRREDHVPSTLTTSAFDAHASGDTHGESASSFAQKSGMASLLHCAEDMDQSPKIPSTTESGVSIQWRTAYR